MWFRAAHDLIMIQLHRIFFCIIIHSFVYIAYHFAFILHVMHVANNIVPVMYDSFEAGATRRTAQVLFSSSETYREFHNSLTSFLHCSVVWYMLA
mgnify:CR=1 FL=1